MHIFKDKVTLVTRSTGEGMGRSIAFTLAREGAKVVLNSVVKAEIDGLFYCSKHHRSQYQIDSQIFSQ